MIPMVDLKVQYEALREEILEQITDVLESSRYILGPKVEELEKGIAAYHGVREAVGVASGTDALNLSLKALGIGRGDEVITTPFTFFATVEAIIYQGARPVFVDIDPETLNIDPAKIEERITERTKAIMPVHMFGMPADMERISAIASKYNLFVVEDCAQSFGAHIRGRKTGSFGDAGCFSFYPSKNLGAYGDGGLITTDNEKIAGRMRVLRNHGSEKGYIHHAIGLNSRLDEIQAAVLLVKFKRIDGYLSLRREKARFYTERLGSIVQCPKEQDGFYHVYHQYTIRSPLRDRIKSYLYEQGISSVVYYPIPLHLQEALKGEGYRRGDFPFAERASMEVLSLPIYPEIDRSAQERVCEAVRKAVA
ncbi:MAG: DegT/DnrJ/EryC1/StrS family aminotransferase [Nitrospirae bacterium]|nr:DegT/DnrJ/EryC1/StrS family aminotransferase [Nitrospirota bacterium]